MLIYPWPQSTRIVQSSILWIREELFQTVGDYVIFVKWKQENIPLLQYHSKLDVSGLKRTIAVYNLLEWTASCSVTFWSSSLAWWFLLHLCPPSQEKMDSKTYAGERQVWINNTFSNCTTILSSKMLKQHHFTTLLHSVRAVSWRFFSYKHTGFFFFFYS